MPGFWRLSNTPAAVARPARGANLRCVAPLMGPAAPSSVAAGVAVMKCADCGFSPPVYPPQIIVPHVAR